MLKKRNLSVRIYNEEDVEEMIVLIRDSFVTAFVDLEKVLEKKVEEVDESWESWKSLLTDLKDSLRLWKRE